MKPHAPTPEQHEFIERVGRWFEPVGTRSAGRILGWLMICEPPHRSAAELAAQLKLSSGSVSTQTTVLEGIGFLERVTFPGDRVSYYQMPPDVWLEQMNLQAERVEILKTMAEAAVDVMPDERPDRIQDMERVSKYFLQQWPDWMKGLAEFLEKENAK